MATSEVKRVIDRPVAIFTQGTLVVGVSGMVVLVTEDSNRDWFEGVAINQTPCSYPLAAHLTGLHKENYRPFKGSVTLTEA